jgi:hypothetical protein
MKYKIGEKHKIYGKVAAAGVREGEPYRMFIKNGDISLIPLACLESKTPTKERSKPNPSNKIS